MLKACHNKFQIYTDGKNMKHICPRGEVKRVNETAIHEKQLSIYLLCISHFFWNIQGHYELYLDKILQEMLECVKIGYLVFDNSIISKAKYLILCLNMQLLRNNTCVISETKLIIGAMITWPTFFCLCCTFIVISKIVTHETTKNVNWIWPHYYFKDIQIFL